MMQDTQEYDGFHFFKFILRVLYFRIHLLLLFSNLILENTI